MKQRSLPLVVSLLALGVGLGLLVRWLGSVAGRPVEPGSAQHDEGAGDGSDSPLLESPLSAGGAAGSSRSTADVREPEAGDARLPEQTFALAGSRTLAGRLIFPADAEPEPELEIVALSLPASAWLAGGELSADQQGASALLREVERFGVEELVNAGDGRGARTDDLLQSAAWARRSVAADGSFEVPVEQGARAVRLFLRARYLFLPDARASEVALPSHGDLDAVLLETALGGRIVVTLQPPAGARAEDLASLAAETLEVAGARGVVVSGRRARFDDRLRAEAGGLLPHDAGYTVALAPDSFPAWLQPRVLVSAGKTTELAAQLTQGVRLAGRVLDARGRPLANVSVQARMNNRGSFGGGARALTRSATTGLAGSFDLRGVPAGEIKLNLRHASHLPLEEQLGQLSEGQQLSELELRLNAGNQVSGRVLFPDGSPAAEAKVYIGPASGGSGRGATTTDEDGAFRFEALEEGPFALLAQKHVADSAEARDGEDLSDSSKPSAPSTWKTEHGEVRAGESVSLQLVPTIALAGRVVDELGQPITAFRVFANRQDFAIRDSERGSYEDAAGRFELATLTPGSWSISVSAAGYTSGVTPELTLPHDAELLVTLVRQSTVTGRVVDPAGAAVAGAHVQARPLGQAARRDAQSDADGSFSLEGLDPGSHEVYALAPGWAPSAPTLVEIDALQPAAQRAELLLQLTTGGRLTGQVYAKDGQPATRQEVVLQRTGGAGQGNTDKILTDEAGLFEVEHLEPGSYQLIALPDTQALAADANASRTAILSQVRTATAEIREGETTHVVVGAPPVDPVRVTGRVTRAGEPVPDAFIMFVGEDRALLDGFALQGTDREGGFETVLDEPGNYTLLVGSETFDDERTTEFNLKIPRSSTTHHVELALPTGGLAGSVVDAHGAPVAGASVSWTRDGALTQLSAMTGNRSARTDQRGRFSFASLADGRYELRARPSAGSAAQAVVSDVVVTGGDLAEGIEIVLSEGGAIVGRVLDELGQPVGRASLFVRDASGSPLQPISSISSGLDGSFRIDRVPAGVATVSARHYLDGRASEELAVDVLAGQQSEVSLVLSSATMLVVSVEDQDGQPLRSSVEVLDAEGRRVDGLLPANIEEAIMTDGVSSTVQRIGPLAPGRYRVRATTPEGLSAERPVTLRGSPEKRVRLQLD